MPTQDIVDNRCRLVLVTPADHAAEDLARQLAAAGRGGDVASVIVPQYGLHQLSQSPKGPGTHVPGPFGVLGRAQEAAERSAQGRRRLGQEMRGRWEDRVGTREPCSNSGVIPEPIVAVPPSETTREAAAGAQRWTSGLPRVWVIDGETAGLGTSASPHLWTALWKMTAVLFHTCAHRCGAMTPVCFPSLHMVA